MIIGRISRFLTAGWLLATFTSAAATGQEISAENGCDAAACDVLPPELLDDSECGALVQFERFLERRRANAFGECDYRYRTPAMIGDFYGGTPQRFFADSVVDRLMVFADDLDAPANLPPGGSMLTISEPGPVGVFSSSVSSVQEIQSLLRAGSPIPAATLVGTINDNATLTTTQSISQIQTQLASTPLPYDVILLQPPPGSYTTAVDGLFQLRNGVPGTIEYDPAHQVRCYRAVPTPSTVARILMRSISTIIEFALTSLLPMRAAAA